MPSRPFSRLSSYEQQQQAGSRRAPLSRSNSNLGRRISYRQQTEASRDSFHYSSGERERAQHRNFRRFGAQTEVERRAVLALIAREREMDISDTSYLARTSGEASVLTNVGTDQDDCRNIRL